MDTNDMSELEQAAYDYGAALSALEGAASCHMPEEFMIKLLEAVMDAQQELFQAATQHFDDVYDGGEL
jgi:hypothetical protein